MEENVISMFMDVKLDIRERKLEFSHLKSWTRYFVRVEAVKCFPCYVKISFFKSHTDDSTDLIVRINIPGLTVQMATSRTRAHSYGLFWKHNRKRCCAYFALPSQLLCERHLRWMKKSIRNLELYRQEILQLRRASRTPLHEIRNEMQPSTSNNDLGLYQNLDFTQNMADVYDILGPLPNVPDQTDRSMARRISGMSGIYEEIFEPGKPSVAMFANGSRMSRASIASGIYEEMKLADIKEQAERSLDESEAAADSVSPPPLPPRPRSHTNEFEIQRSYTTPEADYLKKKKHWHLFESMFGRRRTNSGSASIGSGGCEPKPPKAESGGMKMMAPETNQKVVYRDKVAHLRFAENKRNSFSSPDLSLLKVDGGSTDSLSNGGSCSSEFYVQQDGDFIEEDCFKSSELVSVSKCSSIEDSMANLVITDEEKESQGMNVSENVVPNFNISCNMSTVNLAGWSCIMPAMESAPDALPHPEGYCEMGAPGTGFDRQKLQTVELRSRSTSETCCNDESIYMNMEGKGSVNEEASRSSSTSSGVSSIYSNRSSICSTNRNRNSIDDKIASYYPNEDFRLPKRIEPSQPPTIGFKSSGENAKRSIVKRSESHYATSPKGSRRKSSSPQNISTMPRMSKSAQRPPCHKSRITARSISSERGSSSHPIITITEPTKNSENNPPPETTTTPKLYKKYATIARGLSTSPSKYQEKVSARKGGDPLPAGNTKRFGSLPRFARIDLSPLRLKINSVLQRHNPEI